MGGGGGGVAWRTLGKKWLHSTRALTHTRIPPNSLLSLDLPDVWIPNTNCRFIPSSRIPANEHMATVIDGKSIADDVKSGIAGEICRMKNAVGKLPGLAVLLVGKRRDSRTFIRIKIKACNEVGISSFIAELPEDCTEDEIINVISSYNENPSVHGIIVQLPLPQHLDQEKIVNAVSLEKDVDGFHPTNIGNLAMRGREPLFIPCASMVCIELLLRSGVEIIGKKAVVIGRSRIAGLPTSLLLQRHNATVSTIHAFTNNPEQITSQADIVVTDVGVPNMVRGHWLKQGAVVVDMGTNLVKDPSCRQGYSVTGDVCFEEAIGVVSAITPVPGGVGPVTISMLLSNTLDSAKRAYGFT
ncbi:bifunctional protein FolD 1, mitochondrial-like isoform X1 [Vitis riparia]|uniref:bifunctional protein FolD 1, mitochondrial-like isoform X1 n=1 Tax=Vitis riparia TaxID=96939 RepID=UPI00155ACE24|nr:bifunctional protein FolD 1, mitochondrial-like isoform X1 [Vitis riparia]